MRVAPRCAAYKMTLIALVLLAYLLGSVSFGVLASCIFHLPDPRSYGSKNPGATNVLRSGKKTAAVFTLLGDAGKGWVAVVLARYAGLSRAATWTQPLRWRWRYFWAICFRYFWVSKVEKEWRPHSAYCWASIRGWGCLPPQSGSRSRQCGVFHRWRLWRPPGLAPIYAVFFLGFDARTFAGYRHVLAAHLAA